MKRLFKAMVSLFCGLTLIAGVTACKADVNSGDPVVEIGLFLTQTPVTPVNGDVTVDVTVVPKKVQVLKWLEGEKTIADFNDNGTELTVTDGTASFTVSKAGYYTVYAKVNSKSEAVKAIFVEELAYDVNGLIGLVQNPATPTNGEVTITASVSMTAKTVKYAKGNFSVEDFAGNQIESKTITAGEDGKYSFNVTENGSYTVFADINSKTKGVNIINVTNIDKVAPAQVINLAASYVHAAKTINISWGNPAEADLDHVIVNVKNGNTVIVNNEEVKGTSYKISEYTADNTTTVYISVKAVDEAGNISDDTTFSFIPKSVPEVQSITLDRYHICSTDENKKVNVTAFISNLGDLPEDEIIKIQVMNSRGEAEVNKTAVIDKETGTAKIEFNALFSLGEYTVRVKIGNYSVDTEHTVRLVISEGAKITAMTYSDGRTNPRYSLLKNITDSSTVTYKLTGTNFDLGPVYLYWINSADNTQYGEKVEVDGSAYKWTATTGNSDSVTVTVKMPTPKVEGVYNLKSNAFSGTSLVFYVYGEVEFTEFTTPKLDKSKEDIFVSCIIFGKNFENPKFDVSAVELSCTEASVVSDYKVSVASDGILIVKVVAPGKTGDFEITARYEDKSIKQTLRVRDYSAYTTGSVVLKDKTIIPYSEDLKLTEQQKNDTVGFIAGFDCYGVPFILGKFTYTNTRKYYWSKQKNKIPGEGLEISLNLQNGFIPTSEISSVTGNGMNGNNNMLMIESVTNDLENDFPGFYFCKNYGKSFSYEGEFESGWIMPSVFELVQVWNNDEKLRTVFAEAFAPFTYESYWDNKTTEYKTVESCHFLDVVSKYPHQYRSSSVTVGKFGSSGVDVSKNYINIGENLAYYRDDIYYAVIKTIWDD